MGEVTEIYICKRNQPLKSGRLEISHDITSRASAQADARRKCELDKRIHKIAYYRINDEGDHRILFTYTRPDAEKMIGGDDEAPKDNNKKSKSKPKPKKGFMSKIKSALGG